MILDNIGSNGQIKRKAYQRRLPENPSQDYYYIIRETSPRQSVLIEYGFIDNKNDLSKLQNNLLDYSEGVVKALADYLGVKYTPPVSDGGNGIDNNDYYVVQRGDTLWSIARKVGIPVEQLKSLNNLSNNTIYVGQKLRIVSDDSPQIGENTYVVKKGDSLYSISRKFNTTVDDLVRINNLTSLTLQIGQILRVPGTQEEIYTVQSGDTLYSISRKFNTTVDSIIRANNLPTTVLSIGQELIIK